MGIISEERLKEITLEAARKLEFLHTEVKLVIVLTNTKPTAALGENTDVTLVTNMPPDEAELVLSRALIEIDRLKSAGIPHKLDS